MKDTQAPDSNSTIQGKSIQRGLFLLVLACLLEGAAALAVLLGLPSEAQNAVLLGFSLQRLMLAGVILVPLLGMLAWLFIQPRQPQWVGRVHAFLMQQTLMTASLLASFLMINFMLVHAGEAVLIVRLFPLLIWFTLVCLQLAVYQVVSAIRQRGAELDSLKHALLVAGVFIAAYLVYMASALLQGWMGNRGKAYWHLLAQAFLDGRLYLTDPFQTHDLTFFNGHWYLPPPPLPALLMIPYVLLVGVGSVNTIWFSILFSSFNVMLATLVLDQARLRGWVRLSRAGLLWLVALFAFGTPHWWLGINGMEWFVSQITALTFITLAVLAALRGRSAWIIGVCLALAVTCRPNLVVLWMLLLGIALQLRGESQAANWKWLAGWTLKSAVPVVAVGIGLMVYNQLRFGNPLDFGYTMINGAPQIVEAARRYGLFNLHFVPGNLALMLLRLPDLRLQSPYLFPSIEGMSMLVTTPALFFLVHRYEKKWWLASAWASVGLSILLLSLYHNSGAAQFGFRYVLDFILPLLLLLAYALGKKTSWLFRALVLLSVLINAYGAWWFIHFA